MFPHEFSFDHETASSMFSFCSPVQAEKGSKHFEGCSRTTSQAKYADERKNAVRKPILYFLETIY